MTDLSKYHTKQLLNALQEIRVYKTASQMYEYYENINNISSGTHFLNVKNGQFTVYIGKDPVTEDELKTELATREHVPNKLEAKAIRQEKAKQQKNR